MPSRGADLRYNLDISLEEAFAGRVAKIQFSDGSRERTLNINVEAGIEDGSRIRLRGEGEPGSPPGDLYIFVSIKPHAFFQRDGKDLHCRVPISISTAMYGGAVEIPTLNSGALSVKIPEAIQTGTRIRLKRSGMPVLRSDEVGDLYVQVFIETPDPRNMKSSDFEEFRSLIEKMERQRSTEPAPTRTAASRFGEQENAVIAPSAAPGRPIVISYRRADTTWIAGRILDRLETRFGKEDVFIDIDDMPAGVDFREHLERVLGQCKVLLVLIGPNWTGLGRAQMPKIADPNDWVRIEIETALRRNVPIIPVLIDQTPMPTAEQLPESLKPFAYRQGLQIDPGRDFNVHAERLIHAIDRIVNGSHFNQQG